MTNYLTVYFPFYHRDIYVDALFVLRTTYQENFILEKDDIISQLIANLEDRILSIEDSVAIFQQDFLDSAIAYQNYRTGAAY